MNNQIIEYFNKHGKTHTWYELANMFNILPEGTRKQRADKVRKLYSRSITPVKTEPINDPLLNEFRVFLKDRRKHISYTPKLNGNPNNILVIGDTHIPFEHPDYLKFCLEIQKKYDCGKVIHIGDIVDFNSTTFHNTIPEMPSPAYEFEYSKIKLEEWYQAFPEMTITIGNHDRRVGRKMKDASIQNIWQKSFSEIFGVPNWNFVPDYEYNNIYFCHGEGNTATITALQKQMSSVQGHRHSEQYINFPAKNLFAVQCPLGVDRKSIAFDYARVDPKEWTLGVCVILDNKTPIIERL